ncbi:acetyl-CoA carboxylase biotin carboxylase subunit [Halalkalibacterium ligniniphilum]|uniref:acetyl-CoA carboxylase biotin carboxylase subunit n=1 Tax=Halalkalibacterium ligniniphilum TaxID=1134413 RepID=UPI00034B25FF|nr:acetyl-CoA carboxylase biotin carboxylase subunit [Halalkalibacterium ligniniphilum]
MANINKLLIANRGEIALRIIKTCKKLGIQTVAIFSDADADAPFVKMADESHHIGESQAKKSYLDLEKVIRVARENQVDAIHPGYGFLSENPCFAKRCEEEGIIFVGPEAKVIELMGSKIKARKVMKEAGVPVIPGWDGALDSVEQAIDVASRLGYPLMLKASAGGGGMGMQLVHNEQELTKVFTRTKQSAESYFGDGSLFLEKWIEGPRHIEVQIAADGEGNTVHLFERECSVQRRNQKVVEESLSCFLDEELREKLCQTAVLGAKKIGYSSVGTMEFIFDEDKNFYFLEMNTRLQVEHPVTEGITGVDLVELQIHLAENKPMPYKQDEIKAKGHAIECRVCAEDPETFMPSPGKIEKLLTPVHVRLDFAVTEGDMVSPFYDSMIGKVIVHEGDREKAIASMLDALEQFDIEGVKTNIPLLIQILEHKQFQDGEYTTHFLQNLK